MKLDSAHLELLAALAEHETMSAASKSISLSPSAASRRLQDAERRLGIRLVNLEGRSLQLTAAGRLLADTASRTFREVEEAELAAVWFGAGDIAPVRVGIGFFDHLTWLLPPIESQLYEIVRSPTSQAKDAIDADITIDALGGATSTNDSSDRTAVALDELALATNANHRLATYDAVRAADIADERYLASRPDPLPGFEFESFFLPAGHGPTSIVRMESFAMAMNLIADGSGISIQPRRAVEGLGRTDIALTPLATIVPVTWHANVVKKSPETTEFVTTLTS